MTRLKAYLYVVVGSTVVLAAGAFAALQWGSHSRFSAYGPEVTTRTVWLVLASAGGGVVVLWTGRLLVRGLSLLWGERRREQRVLSKVRKEAKG